METPTNSGSYEPASNPMLPREETLPPVTPTPGPIGGSSSPSHRWGMLAGFFVLALAVSAGAYFVLSEKYSTEPVISTYTPRETMVSQKTYTNTGFGFEIKYPASLAVLVSSTGANNFQKRSAGIVIDTPEKIAELRRLLAGPGGGIPSMLLTLTAYEPRKRPAAPFCGEPGDPRVGPVSPIVNIGGVTVQKCGGFYMDGSPYNLFRFSPDGIIYFDVLAIYYGEIGQQDVAEEILATFKFTK